MSLADIQVIVFDVDGTLTEEISWLKLTECLGADPLQHSQIYEAFKAHQLSYDDAKRQLIGLWQQTGRANRDVIKKIFSDWNVKADAVEIIEYLKQKYEVILISGSVDIYIEVLADRLGIATWYANTQLVWDENGNLSDFHYELNQAKKKVEQLEEYLQQSGYTKKECLVIGDGDSDLDLFKVLPYGIAVNKEPHPELEKLAYQKISDLSELKRIL
jgi:HAD superfamily phosphoserine phosphatase-like hydrolase